MILWWAWRFGLFRAVDGEKLRFFVGWGPPGSLSRQSPLWRHFPWGRALFSPRGSREIAVWLAYRIDLFDGRAG